jgi:TPR repeat protein
MRNLGYLLETTLTPPDLEGARGWYEKAAGLGNTDAMVNLGYLLGTTLTPPDLEGARGWYEKAADLGNTDGALGLGNLFALKNDRDAAATAWQQAVTLAGTPQSTGSAALNLAALETLEGHLEQARELLGIAAECGFSVARFCASTLAADGTFQESAYAQLENESDDTDALNFIGLAAYRAGDRKMAVTYWTRSSNSGDTVGPLLLSLSRGQVESAKPQLGRP